MRRGSLQSQNDSSPSLGRTSHVDRPRLMTIDPRVCSRERATPRIDRPRSHLLGSSLNTDSRRRCSGGSREGSAQRIITGHEIIKVQPRTQTTTLLTAPAGVSNVPTPVSEASTPGCAVLLSPITGERSVLARWSREDSKRARRARSESSREYCRKPNRWAAVARPRRRRAGSPPAVPIHRPSKGSQVTVSYRPVLTCTVPSR